MIITVISMATRKKYLKNVYQSHFTQWNSLLWSQRIFIVLT